MQNENYFVFDANNSSIKNTHGSRNERQPIGFNAKLTPTQPVQANDPLIYTPQEQEVINVLVELSVRYLRSKQNKESRFIIDQKFSNTLDKIHTKYFESIF